MSSTASTESGPNAPRRKFHADLIVPRTAKESYNTFQRLWQEQVGDVYPLPPTKPTSDGPLRASVHASKMHDAVIADLHLGSPVVGGTGSGFDHLPDMVTMHVVQGGTWRFNRLRERDLIVVPAGQFIVRFNGPSWRFAVEANTMTKKLNLPVAHLLPLIGDRPFLGSADSAEVRLLLAHIRMVDAGLDALSPAGVRAARNALIELVIGVLTQRVDGTESQLAPSLVQAAKDLVDTHLSDSELSPTMLARQLSVSTRTLQRAFATANESLSAYIRDQRLEQARLALTQPTGRPTVSELAANWRFADSSHLCRVFKKRYGQTPIQYARSYALAHPRDTL